MLPPVVSREDLDKPRGIVADPPRRPMSSTTELGYFTLYLAEREGWVSHCLIKGGNGRNVEAETHDNFSRKGYRGSGGSRPRNTP